MPIYVGLPEPEGARLEISRENPTVRVGDAVLALHFSITVVDCVSGTSIQLTQTLRINRE